MKMGSNHLEGAVAPIPQFAGLYVPLDDFDPRRGHPERQRIWVNGTRARIKEWAEYGPEFRRLARLHILVSLRVCERTKITNMFSHWSFQKFHLKGRSPLRKYCLRGPSQYGRTQCGRGNIEFVRVR